jgi:hypothetical protein
MKIRQTDRKIRETMTRISKARRKEEQEEKTNRFSNNSTGRKLGRDDITNIR